MKNKSSNLASDIVDSRKKLGLSQEGLAEKANVSLSTIQRIEKGTVKPRSHTLKVLAKALELDASELLLYLVEKSRTKPSFSALKFMNLLTLILVFIPFFNLVIPLIIWNKNKEIASKDRIAGKLLSFQLLWSFLTIIGMFILVFLTNLITGQAGFGHYTSGTLYLLAVIINIFVIAKTSSQLNNEDENILSFVPNLF